jgi:3',5'-cyclic AMP phosphodiesterase CpdA
MSVPASRVRGSAALVVALLLATACAAAPPANDAAQTGDAPVIAAVGDIACNSLPSDHDKRCGYDRVAELLHGMDLDAFLALGDIQYLKGAYDDFVRYYDRFFGFLKEITYPVPGNHESYTRNLAGYMKYFGDRVFTAGDYITNAGFYSFDIGDWHLIALNSQLCKGSTLDADSKERIAANAKPRQLIPGCGPGDSEYEWLVADLAAHPNDEYPCTLVFFHHPVLVWNPYIEQPYWPGPLYYSLTPMWRLLQDQGVDVVLNGHYHNYQRFEPQDFLGRPDPSGMTEFIVGSGGVEHEPLPSDITPPPAFVNGTGDTWGVLEMTLRANGYDFAFRAAPGEPAFEDSGSGDCH